MLFGTLFIIFIAMTFVKKIMLVSVVDFYDTGSEYCIMCPPHKVKLSSVTVYSHTIMHASPWQPELKCTGAQWILGITRILGLQEGEEHTRST